ncbi:PLC-like phosphodiesterase [Pholiota molesta]|nr:PLC-like phosphodiesterase [Pholiota molesta]
MLLTIRNLSTDAITGHEFLIYPSADFTTSLSKGHEREIVIRQTRAGPDVSDTASVTGLVEKEWHIHPESFKIRLSLTLEASWQVVDVPKGCPWRVYTSRITRKHHKILILGRRNLGSFLSELPDGLPLSSVVLPGSMAFHGWPISQCQSLSTPLSVQLLGGIRVIDIRLAVIPPPIPGSTTLTSDQQLIAYHGLWPQKTPFLAILHNIQAFLTSPIGSKETIVMSVKQEDFAVTPAPLFSQLVHQTIVNGPDGWSEPNSTASNAGVNKGMWFLENRIPKLGEVRGNGAGWEGGLEGLGIHPTTWPDSQKEGFEWELKGTRVRTHDWYAIPSFFSIPEKVYLATKNLIPPTDTKQPLLPITYFSAASFPLAFPPTIAQGFGWPKWGIGIEGVNSRLGAWLLDQLGGSIPASDTKAAQKDKEKAISVAEEPRIRGWTFLDYYSQPEDGGIIPLLVECNYRGRKKGEEGW